MEKRIRKEIQKSIKKFPIFNEHTIIKKIPKINQDSTTDHIINKVDKIVKEILEKKKNICMEELVILIYAAAWCVVKFCNFSPLEIKNKIPKSFPNDDKEQQELFKNSPKKFYKLLFNYSSEDSVSEKAKNMFWTQMWKCDKKETFSNLLCSEIKRIQTINVKMAPTIISEKDIKKALKKMKNWAPAGIDGIQIFWVKKFTSCHPYLIKCINFIIDEPQKMPKFLTEGVTTLVPKISNPVSPSDYRPMTTLPSIYKLISKCLSQKILDYYNSNNILAEEQMGDKKGCGGAKKILTIDSIVMKKADFWGVYLDYKKALDSVSHGGVLKILEIYQIDEKFQNFLKFSMSQWTTRLENSKSLIHVERGLFQGDPLSVVLFWTLLNPLSFMLRQQKDAGLDIKSVKITHLQYMDDVKLFSNSFDDLCRLYKVFLDYSTQIGMTINYDKSYIFQIVNGQLRETSKSLDRLQNLKKPEKFLGYYQIPGIDNDINKQQKLASFLDKVRKLSNTGLSNEMKITAILYQFNATFSKSFGLLNWQESDVEGIIDMVLQICDIKINSKKLSKVRRKLISDVFLKILTKRESLNEYFRKENTYLAQIVKSD